MKKLNIKNLLLVCTVSAFVSVTSIFASEEICDLSGKCYEYELGEAKPYVHLIANEHNDIGKAFEATLGEAALNKKIVVVQESVPRNSNSENVAAKQRGHKSKGYFFGIEGEMADTFMDFTYHNLFIYLCGTGEKVYLSLYKDWAEEGISEILLSFHMKILNREVILSFLDSNQFEGISKPLISDLRKFASKKLALSLELIGAKQKLPTWFGPPFWSKRMFQSVHPAVPLLKSLIIEIPYLSPLPQN